MDRNNYTSFKELGRGDQQQIAYENFANAIILRACEDYMSLDVDGYVNDSPARYINKNEIEKFFHSEWFKELTSVDGDYLIKVLKEEAKTKADRRKRGLRKEAIKLF